MSGDIRAEAARYYDLNPNIPDDLEFYRLHVPSPEASILELGCGTGRVLVPLAEKCAYIHGIDSSEAMVSLCRKKLAVSSIPDSRARVQVDDITDVDLHRQFDLITAPFRVFQNLETDAQTDGFFHTVRRHLSSQGTCILNVFNPNRDADAMRTGWVSQDEIVRWEIELGNERIVCSDKYTSIDAEKLILYPELIYRRFAGDELVDETILRIAMRCYYPDEFEQIITDHGFTVLQRWGGYHGEPYGVGAELVVEFGEG